MIDDYLESFAGLPVSDYTSGDTGADAADLPPADSVAWRIATDWDDSHPFTELWTAFLDTVAADRVRAVVIGSWWGDDYSDVRPVLDALIASADRLPALRALFLGDMRSEECEISWIQQDDVTPVLEAYPGLEEFTVRGCGTGPRASGRCAMSACGSWRSSPAGCRPRSSAAVGASDLPALQPPGAVARHRRLRRRRHADDLAPILAGARLPALTLPRACATPRSPTRSRPPSPARRSWPG